MTKIVPPSCRRNNYKIHYSRIHDNWLVSVKRNNEWVALEEFALKNDAIKWAEEN